MGQISVEIRRRPGSVPSGNQQQAAFSPALLLLGFVLGPLIETNLRRALLVSRGDLMIFLKRPIACGFVIATVALLIYGLAKQGRQGPASDKAAV